MLAVAICLALAPGAAAGQVTAGLDLPPPPAARPAPAPPQPAQPALSALLDDLRRFRQTTPRGTTGMVVIDGAGRQLSARRPQRSLLPASTAKLFTAAAALRVLGPDHRFVTRVYATRPPNDAGVVDGDLVVVGGGDPALVTPRYRRVVDRARPATSLRTLAQRIARSGVTAVRGRVLGDPTILADQPLAAGWRADYLTSLDATRSSGLTVDAGLRLFRRSGRVLATAAGDPARRTAAELDHLLGAAGVRTAGPPGAGRLRTGATEVARIASPPLEQLLAHLLRESDNHLADGVFRMLGAATGDPTWRGSATAVRRALRDVPIAWRDVRLADGSGLSRADRSSPDALVQLLRAMAAGPQRRRWLRLLPVTGRTGTVASRLAGTQGAGRLHAKTGTLRDVRALAGTVPGPGGRDHHIAVIANDLTRYDDVLASRRLADVVALAVIAAQDGCRRPIPPPTDERPRAAPESRICGAAPRRASR